MRTEDVGRSGCLAGVAGRGTGTRSSGGATQRRPGRGKRQEGICTPKSTGATQAGWACSFSTRAPGRGCLLPWLCVAGSMQARGVRRQWHAGDDGVQNRRKVRCCEVDLGLAIQASLDQPGNNGAVAVVLQAGKLEAWAKWALEAVVDVLVGGVGCGASYETRASRREGRWAWPRLSKHASGNAGGTRNGTCCWSGFCCGLGGCSCVEDYRESKRRWKEKKKKRERRSMVVS